MKILHLTDQLSKKNYSISSLILYISSFKSSTKKEISVASGKVEKKFLNISNDISILNINNWINFFFFKLNRFNYVHVHGICAFLQILTILFCIQNKIKVFVHPHGMLLDDALKSGGLVKYFLKIISLRILSIFFKKINFISITNQEKTAVKYFFKGCKISLIENPIPFKKYKITNNSQSYNY